LPTSDVYLRWGVVVLRGAGRPERYNIPVYGGAYRKVRELSVLGSRSTHGYLCLVRFQPDQPAVAVVADEPVFMGGGAQLVALAPYVGHRQTTPGGFRNYSINTSIGAPVAITDDTRFFGIGDSDADSGDPVRVFTVDDHGDLVNVSADYPEHIERDAAKAWHQFHHPKNGPYLGAIATWAADECSLGNQADAFSELDRLQAEHAFAHFTVFRHGHSHHASYAHFLERRLAKWGYTN
jgi:hypothetical protein